MLHRICRLYGALALIVPVAGLVLGLLWGKLDEAWLVVAMIATAAAGVLYALRIVPAQAKALAARPSPRAARALAGAVGAFDILWLVVLILMVLQPGGTRS